jgi:RNA polymerase sigma-70 factor (ECF subfamily)
MNAMMESTEKHTDYTDEQLLIEYRATGNQELFNMLVQRYEGEIFAYLRQYLGNADAADDVFQHTFLQLHLKCDKFQEGRALRPWLYTLAIHQAIDYQRRNRRHQAVSLERRIGDAWENSSGTLVDMIESDAVEPVEYAEAQEQRDEVRKAVGELPEHLRQVVILIYFQGLKYREAAEALEVPLGTIKSRLNSAMQKLQLSLGELQLA